MAIKQPRSIRRRRQWFRHALCLVACAAWAMQCSGSPVAEEARRLVRDAGFGSASVIAEIGAGDGQFAVELGRQIGSAGRIYATELGQQNVTTLWKRVQGAGALNVSIVAGRPDGTMLPDNSCDVVIVRRTYHHFSHPAEMARSIWKSLHRGGLLIAIEQPFTPFSQSGRTGPRPRGDGINEPDLRQELNSAGFEHIKTIQGWSGQLYLSVFRKSP